MAQVPRSSIGKFTKTLDVSSVPAQSLQEETFSVPGLRLGQEVAVRPVTRATSFATGLQIIGAFIAANAVLTIVFFNPTTAAINPASQAWVIEVR